MSKSKTDRRGKRPKSELLIDALGSTLLVSLPAVEPQVQDFIVYQTMRFVQDLIDNVNNVNKNMTLKDQVGFAYVDSF